MRSQKQGWIKDFRERGVGLIFKIFVYLFLALLNWFSERSQSTKKTLFRPNFLRCRQNLKQKQAKKGVSRHFLEKFDQKNRVFAEAGFSLKTWFQPEWIIWN